MDKRFGRMLPLNTAALLLLAALFAGCATTQVSGPSGQDPASAAFASAAQLARQHATLSGQARTDNAREIDRLLAGLDNPTLARDAAALPAGDPLDAFAGRALLNRGLPLPRPFDRGGQWNFDLNGRPAADRDGYRPPVKLAVTGPSGPAPVKLRCTGVAPAFTGALSPAALRATRRKLRAVPLGRLPTVQPRLAMLHTTAPPPVVSVTT